MIKFFAQLELVKVVIVVHKCSDSIREWMFNLVGTNS